MHIQTDIELSNTSEFNELLLNNQDNDDKSKINIYKFLEKLEIDCLN